MISGRSTAERPARSAGSNRIARCLSLAVALAFTWALALAANAGPAFDQGRLWRVSKPGSPDSFVFGTIHASDRRVALVPRVVRDAMSRTRILATEAAAAPLPDAVRLIAVPADYPSSAPAYEFLQPGVGLETLVSDRTMSAVRTKLAGREPGYPAIERLKHALAHLALLAATREDAIRSWLAGDLAGLARMPSRIAHRHPELRTHYDALIRHIVVDRTAVMHHRAFMEMRRGGVMVAIGAAHLPGGKGLLNLLREDGYRVTRIW